MRKALAVFTIAILGFMIGSRATTLAQDSAAKPEMNAKPSKRAEKPVHAYRVDFSLNELEDGKKINTRQYSVNVNSDESNEIKIGTRVPVESKEEEFQYLDVGTNVWCRIEERSDGVA
jgi:hypothetical protein